VQLTVVFFADDSVSSGTLETQVVLDLSDDNSVASLTMVDQNVTNKRWVF